MLRRNGGPPVCPAGVWACFQWGPPPCLARPGTGNGNSVFKVLCGGKSFSARWERDLPGGMGQFDCRFGTKSPRGRGIVLSRSALSPPGARPTMRRPLAGPAKGAERVKAVRDWREGPPPRAGPCPTTLPAGARHWTHFSDSDFWHGVPCPQDNLGEPILGLAR